MDSDTEQLTSKDLPSAEDIDTSLPHLDNHVQDAENTASNMIYDVNSEKQPLMLAYACTEFSSNFLKGCKWSCDGTALLSCSDDCKLRIFNLPEQFYSGDFSHPIPEMQSSITIKEGGTIYDYQWSPQILKSDDITCCVAATSQNSPIHLWNTLTGDLEATYKATNHMEEIDAAHSVAFSPDCSFIFAGFKKKIFVFDVNQPGKQIESFSTHKKRQSGQHGIISCFDFAPSSLMFAAGSYSSSVAIYDQRSYSQVMIFEGHVGGVTQVKFSQDENLLFSGARKDNELLTWDMRNPGQILAVLMRDVQTNQRMYFDIDPSSRYVCSGNYNGDVSIWDLTTINYDDGNTEQEISPQLCFKAQDDCVNACCFHPSLAMVATSSGQRSASSSSLSDSESDSDNVLHRASENSIKLHWLGL